MESDFLRDLQEIKSSIDYEMGQTTINHEILSLSREKDDIKRLAICPYIIAKIKNPRIALTCNFNQFINCYFPNKTFYDMIDKCVNIEELENSLIIYAEFEPTIQKVADDNLEETLFDYIFGMYSTNDWTLKLSECTNTTDLQNTFFDWIGSKHSIDFFNDRAIKIDCTVADIKKHIENSKTHLENKDKLYYKYFYKIIDFLDWGNDFIKCYVKKLKELI